MDDTLRPLYSVAEIRAIEQAALAAVAPGTLMARAGEAAARLALAMLGSVVRRRILALAGPGNNGGDALVAAHLLSQMGADVYVMPLFAENAAHPADAQQALAQCRAGRTQFIAPDPNRCANDRWDLVIDGLFGIGLRRNLDERTRALVRAANALPCPRLALDVPSGLDADTGIVVDEQGCAFIATRTLTFLADKPGLHTGLGRDHAGEVTVADLDVAPALLPPAQLHRSGVAAFRSALRQRRHGTHKGSHGDVIVVGGAAGMTGGAILAARAALYAGAGRVHAALIAPGPAYDSLHPELMLRSADEVAFKDSVIVAGPGMGRSSQALLAKVLDAPNPAVLDADALNMLAVEPALKQRLAQREGATLITPHPLEAARLLQQTTTDIQRNRVAAARELTRRFNCIAVLKGSGSVIAAPDGAAMINPTGNPALATAGSGDVLSGICGALLAQGFPCWQAALAAVWLHGAAADKLVSEGVGPIGATAGELIVPVRALLNELTAHYGN